MNESYIPYEQIASCLQIQTGDRVYLSSNIMQLAFLAMQHGEQFSPDRLIDSFQQILSPEGTLLIPTFHFNFSNHGIYDYCNTPCSTGALGNAALKRADFKRTLHPMHSFAVWGKDQSLLCFMENRNSFGDDSPFGYMLEKNVIQIMLGADYQQCMTFVHFVERQADVPYRFYKEFTGTYTDANGISNTRTYEYPARYLEMGSVEKFNRIGKILEEKSISKKILINNLPVIRVPLADSYPIIYEDAKNNMARNLYDFNCPREHIWKNN